jgi:hypothetical protein
MVGSYNRQEQVIFREHMGSDSGFGGVHVAYHCRFLCLVCPILTLSLD